MSAKKEQRLEESWKRLRRIFFPKSVVLIGVSSAPSNLARVIVRNLTDLKFNGQVFCVGAGGGSIGGCCIYRSLEEVPATPDLAVLLIAASHIPATLEICGKKGVHDVVVETAGFCEFDEQRKYLEQEILDVARRWDITILGPNCIGVINMENGMALPFMPLDYRDMKKGSVSIISQSGGLLHDIVRRCCLENIGLSKVISIGNKMMLDENDFIGTLTADPSTQVIGIYLEDIRDGRMLMELSASCPKPVVALKSNTSGSSAEIARFHTSAVAVDDAVVSAAFRQCGIHRVESLAEMMDLFKTFSLPLLRGHKLLLLSRSGGQAVLLADAAHCHGFQLASLSERFFSIVGRGKADIIRRTNPLDMGDIFDMEHFGRIVEAGLKEKSVDGVVFVHGYAYELEEAGTEMLIRNLHRLTRAYDKPIVLCMIADKRRWFHMREIESFPLFDGAETALRALRASLIHFQNQSKTQHATFSKHKAPGTVTHNDVAILDVANTFSLLQASGITVPPFALVTNKEEAIEACSSLGYPVALKVASPGVLHKTENFALRLDIKDDKSIGQAIQQMPASMYLLQKMVPEGHECLVGARRDNQFGSVAIFGMGGIFVELLNKTSIRICPINEGEAVKMIEEAGGQPIFVGYRGRKRLDIQAAVRALLAVSRILEAHSHVLNIEINPLIVLSEGEGCYAVDARIEVGIQRK